jgi:hypothetical protein
MTVGTDANSSPMKKYVIFNIVTAISCEVVKEKAQGETCAMYLHSYVWTNLGIGSPAKAQATYSSLREDRGLDKALFKLCIVIAEKVITIKISGGKMKSRSFNGA